MVCQLKTSLTDIIGCSGLTSTIANSASSVRARLDQGVQLAVLLLELLDLALHQAPQKVDFAAVQRGLDFPCAFRLQFNRHAYALGPQPESGCK